MKVSHTPKTTRPIVSSLLRKMFTENLTLLKKEDFWILENGLITISSLTLFSSLPGGLTSDLSSQLRKLILFFYVRI
jgi:hypothetical protein